MKRIALAPKAHKRGIDFCVTVDGIDHGCFISHASLAEVCGVAGMMMEPLDAFAAFEETIHAEITRQVRNGLR